MLRYSQSNNSASDSVVLCVSTWNGDYIKVTTPEQATGYKILIMAILPTPAFKAGFNQLEIFQVVSQPDGAPRLQKTALPQQDPKAAETPGMAASGSVK